MLMLSLAILMLSFAMLMLSFAMLMLSFGSTDPELHRAWHRHVCIVQSFKRRAGLGNFSPRYNSCSYTPICDTP